MSSTDIHPCLTCGVCCQNYRVEFSVYELRSMGGTVPDELAHEAGSNRARMNGTQYRPVRCAALGPLPDVGPEAPVYWQEACRHLMKRDRVMKKLIPQHPGVSLQSRGDAFVTLARSIVGQQISVKAAQSVCELQASQRLCLTGTPMENNLGELWSLFHFLMPGWLGDLKRFNQDYRTPIERQGDSERMTHLARRRPR